MKQKKLTGAQRAMLIRGWRPTANAVGSVTEEQLKRMREAQKRWAKDKK